MSSTNRKPRPGPDYYVTPLWAIKDFLDAAIADCSIRPQASAQFPPRMSILDPCVGGDSKHPMSYPYVLDNDFGIVNVDTLDIREDSKAAIKTDFLTWTPDHEYDLVITNPPFKNALDIIKKAFAVTRDGGIVVMLLRLNFLGTIKRFGFFQETLPHFIYVHHKRLSFSDDGKRDSIEYAHFVWEKGWNPRFARTKVI